MADYSRGIWDYLLAKIGNKYGVAALMGNLQAESGLQPNNLQNSYETALGFTDESYTAAVDSGSYTRSQFINDQAGYGLAQWTYSTRKATLYDTWKNNGFPSIADITLQLSVLYAELVVSYAGVLRVLESATSIREASDKVLHDFENPADQSTSVEVYRASLGQAWYDLYSEGGGGEGPVVPPSPTPAKRKTMPLWLMYAATRRRV